MPRRKPAPATYSHYPAVERYIPLERFKWFEQQVNAMGFRHAACGPMVRSRYHADQMAHDAGIFSAN